MIDLHEVALAAAMLKGVTKPIDINSWYGFRDIVERGLASRYFREGDQVACMRSGERLIWDIIGIDADKPADPSKKHSLTLGLHDCFTELQPCARQALFVFPEGLAAGTYHFTVGEQPWHEGDVGKTIQFTLMSAIPEGGQLVANSIYNTTMIGNTISAFASSTAATAAETVLMSEGNDGTDLGTITNARDDTNGINSIQRALLGSNNWNDSAIKQYINSDAAAGSVWTPKTDYDRPPSWAATTAGFLSGMDPDFLSVVGRVKKRTALNTVSDGGGYIDTDEKFFLLSRSEVYAGLESSVDEGDPYDYYKDFSDLPSAGGGKDANRTKRRNGAAKYWLLRTPFTFFASNVRIITTSGELYFSSATNNYGVAPACCIV